MDAFNRDTLLRLTSHNQGPCVSLFLETHPTGQDSEQDTTRLKNLLRDAEQQLQAHGVGAAAAHKLLEPPANLPSNATFWQKRCQGLAIFIAPGLFETFRVSQPVAEKVVVSDWFCVRPLLPLLEQNLSFYLLTISENRVAMYLVDEQSIQSVEVPELPTRLTESLNYDGADRGAQAHSASRGATGKQAAVYHGQGGQPDTMKVDLSAYCALIDKSVTAWLGDSARPMLVAGVERLVAAYREKNSYRHLLDESLPGNQDRASEHDLHVRAWPVVEPLLRVEGAKAAHCYMERPGQQTVNDDPCEIVMAAVQGRIDWLLYDPTAELYGTCVLGGLDAQVTGQGNDDDLVELAAVETIRHGGTIHAMTDQDVPTNSPLAAGFRY
jgi:hypothetical protein